MADREPDIQKGGRKDSFWVAIIAGVIVVTAGAFFAGNYLAKVMLKGDNAQVETAPGDVEITDDTASEEPEEVEERVDNIKKAPVKVKEDRKSEGSRDKKEEKSGARDGNKKEPGSSEISIEVTKGESADKKETTATQDSGEKTEQPAQTTTPSGDKEPEDKAGSEDTDDSEKPAANVIYVLQLGVYQSKENATKMKDTLQKEYNMEVYVAQINVDGEVKYRVQMGAFKDKGNAQKLGRELQIKGYRYYISEQAAGN